MEGLLHPASHTWWGRLQHALPFQPYGCHTSITTQENRLMIHRLLSPCISIGVRSLVLCLATPRWFPWAPFWTSLHADRGFCLLLCGENPIDELLQCPQKMTCVYTSPPLPTPPLLPPHRKHHFLPRPVSGDMKNRALESFHMDPHPSSIPGWQCRMNISLCEPRVSSLVTQYLALRSWNTLTRVSWAKR